MLRFVSRLGDLDRFSFRVRVCRCLLVQVVALVRASIASVALLAKLALDRDDEHHMAAQAVLAAPWPYACPAAADAAADAAAVDHHKECSANSRALVRGVQRCHSRVPLPLVFFSS